MLKEPKAEQDFSIFVQDCGLWVEVKLRILCRFFESDREKSQSRNPDLDL